MIYLTAIIAFVAMQGCSSVPGVSSYQPVDLGRDLDAATLSRYRAEAETAAQAGQQGHMLVLERANRWPLGVLAYWKQGEVQAMHRSDGQLTYSISASQGYGPLSVLYVSGNGAVFDPDGKRLSGMSTGSVLWGHLAMVHAMAVRLGDGQWHEHTSAGFLHHLINVGTEHGNSCFYLFSMPNPVGSGG
jgi:hypothetical protein